VHCPELIPVTSPAETVATVSSEDVHFISDLSTEPFDSIFTVKDTVVPTGTETVSSTISKEIISPNNESIYTSLIVNISTTHSDFVNG